MIMHSVLYNEIFVPKIEQRLEHLYLYGMKITRKVLQMFVSLAEIQFRNLSGNKNNNMTNNERYDSVLEIACPVSVGVFPSVLNE
jgi:hypothetical protein